MIRTLWVWCHALIATFPLSLVVVIASWFGASVATFEVIARFWARWVLWASGVTVQLEGCEHIPTDRPVIFAANHQSWYDVFALAAHTPRPYRFVAKKELARIPLFGRAWQTAGHIAIDRADREAAIQALNRAADMMRSDNSAVVIFPEGTRSPDGELLPFKKGAFMLALHSHIEIVPTAVCGSRDILRKGGWRVRAGTLIVRFGRPIDTTGYHEVNRDELIARVRDGIQMLLHRTPPTT